MTEAPAVDKSTWGPGAWQSEPDRVDFVHAGFACFALRHDSLGHWCGYVGVPREHPAYGKPYGDVNVEFHGGLTYSAACRDQICHVPAPGMPDDVWWLGGDFAHCWDLSPGTEARLAEALVKARAVNAPWADALDRLNHDASSRFTRDDVYRDLAYVRAEIERLAEQLAVYPVSDVPVLIAGD